MWHISEKRIVHLLFIRFRSFLMKQHYYYNGRFTVNIVNVLVNEIFGEIPNGARINRKQEIHSYELLNSIVVTLIQ